MTVTPVVEALALRVGLCEGDQWYLVIEEGLIAYGGMRCRDLLLNVGGRLWPSMEAATNPRACERGTVLRREVSSNYPRETPKAHWQIGTDVSVA